MSNELAIKNLISERMKWLRVELFQMTQKEFAVALGNTHQHIISGYESGQFRPGISRCFILIEMAKKYGKKIDFHWLRPDLEEKEHG